MPRQTLSSGSSPACRRPHRSLVQALCLSLLITSVAPAFAQFRDRPTLSPRIPASRNLSTELKMAGKPTTSDYIVAVVNPEPITHTAVDTRVMRIQDSAPAGSRWPAR